MDTGLGWNCSACGRGFKSPLSAAGKSVLCKCGAKNRIPVASKTVGAPTVPDESSPRKAKTLGVDRSAKVIVHRPKKLVGGQRPVVVILDGKNAGELSSGQTKILTIEPGKHSVLASTDPFSLVQAPVLSPCYQMVLLHRESVSFEAALEFETMDLKLTEKQSHSEVKRIRHPSKMLLIPADVVHKIHEAKEAGESTPLFEFKYNRYFDIGMSFASLLAVLAGGLLVPEMRPQLKTNVLFWSFLGLSLLAAITWVVATIVRALKGECLRIFSHGVQLRGADEAKAITIPIREIESVEVSERNANFEVATLVVKPQHSKGPAIMFRNTKDAAFIKAILDFMISGE